MSLLIQGAENIVNIAVGNCTVASLPCEQNLAAVRDGSLANFRQVWQVDKGLQRNFQNGKLLRQGFQTVFPSMVEKVGNHIGVKGGNTADSGFLIVDMISVFTGRGGFLRNVGIGI